MRHKVRNTSESDVRTVAEQAYDPRFYDAPVYAEKAQVFFAGTQQFSTRLAAIQDMCAHVRIVSGRCVGPSAQDDMLVSARTVAAQHIEVGSEVRVAAADKIGSVQLHVVGVYQPVDPDGSFWSPWGFFDEHPSLSDSQPAKLDSFLVAPAALSSRLTTLGQTLMANVRLLPSKVHLDDRTALDAAVARAKSSASRRTSHASSNFRGLTATTATSLLPSVLAGMSREMSLARSLIAVASAQLALLAIVILFAAVAGTASAHSPEVALARLRGRQRRSVLLQGVLQPVVLIVLATPVGAVLAWVAVRLLAPHLLHRTVEVVFPLSAITVAAVAAAGGIVAAVLAARRIVVSSVGTLLRPAGEGSGSSLGLAVADAAVVMLALAGIVQLMAGGELDSGSTDPLSAVAPALLAVAGAVIVVRLLPYAGRRLVRWTRDSGRLATFLAVRQLVRRPVAARAMILVAVALALAAFAVVDWSAARTNRQERALSEAGAATVLDVRPSSRIEDLRVAVDAADPSGHAMAVAYARPVNSTPLIAVDTTRFAGIGAWGASNSASPLDEVLARLRAPTPPAVTFGGSRLRLTVDVSQYPKYPVQLAVQVTGSDHQLTELNFGTMPRRLDAYTRAPPADCRSGCRFSAVSLSVNMPNSAILDPDTKLEQLTAVIGAQVSSGGAWTAVTGFDQPQRWRSDGRSVAQIGHAGTSLSVLLRQTSQAGPWATLQAAAVPAELPAVVASGTAALYRGAALHDASTVGLDGQSLPIDGVVRAVSLPQLGRTGAMVDFGQALAAMAEPAALGTRFEVWLTDGAPRDLAARLAAQGVTVTRVVRAAQFQRPLDRTGPAYADSLFLVAAIAAIVLALGGSVLGAIMTAPRRSYEFAALTAVGVPIRTLRRACAAEQAMLLGGGLVVGFAAGIGGSLLALPSTPYFVDDTVGPPRDNALPWQPLVLLAAVLVIVAALTSAAVGWFAVRHADAARLREVAG